jgi:hypothetical protein
MLRPHAAFGDASALRPMITDFRENQSVPFQVEITEIFTWNGNARRDAAPKCEAFRKGRRDRVPAAADTHHICMDANLM